jgi:Pyruvate/2-oxoacid:ferredoxin oxidoreductase gamma subunit
VSYDIAIAGVGGQPIDRLVELLAAVCAQAGEPFLSTAPRGVHLLGGTRLAQVSIGPCYSSIVTEDTGEALVALEAGEALRYAKFCARDGVAFIDRVAIAPSELPAGVSYPTVEALEAAVREFIPATRAADFGAIAEKAGATRAHAYAVILGAISKADGLGVLDTSWKQGLANAKADAGETAAFSAGAKWAQQEKPPA